MIKAEKQLVLSESNKVNKHLIFSSVDFLPSLLMKVKMLKIANELNSYLKLYEILGMQFFSLKAASRENSNQRLSIWRIVQAILFMALITLFGGIIFFDRKSSVVYENLLTYIYQQSIIYLIFLVYWTNLLQSLTSNERIKKFFLNSEIIYDLCRQHFAVKMNFADVRRAS